MASRFLSRLNALLQKPLFGTKVIPRDARVDPTRFPEDEFPVYCLKCQYLLRGLPDGRCPECGEQFDRGRLLVRRYALDWQDHPELRSGKYWAFAFTIAIVAYWIGTAKLIQWYIQVHLSSSPEHFDVVSRRALWLMIARFILFIVGSSVLIWVYLRSKTAVAERAIKRKRRRIIDAYFRDHPV